MIELVTRTFDIDAPLDETWAHLMHVESWPSWAKHIKTATPTPAGTLTATSVCRMRLKGGMHSTLRVEEFQPPRHWSWVGRLLTVRVHYHHSFESIGDRTRLTWSADAEGFGATVVRPVLAFVLARFLDKEILNLPAEFASAGSSGGIA